jgi:4-amino-4-deoxy-L-arabinose transferase
MYTSLINIDRILISTLLFTIFLLAYGALFMKLNELKINSTKPLAEWIKDQRFQHKNILVYDRLLPSLAFHLNQDIISLHDGNRYLKREVNFEKDDQWKKWLYDLTDSSEADRLKPLLQSAPIMIVMGPVKPSSQWLLSFFSQQHKEGDWIIYF